MKIQICSDVHCDKYTFNIPEKILGLGEGVDVLVLAGDISHSETIHKHKDFFTQVNKTYKKIIYVLGNHEFYNDNGLKIEFCEATIRAFLCQFENFVVLQNESYIIENCIFSGCTFWFNPPKPRLDPWFRIPITATELMEKHKSSLCYLKMMNNFAESNEMKHVVITHYPIGYTQKIKNFNELTDSLSADDLNYIQPDVWISGHTHVNHNIRSDNGKTLYVSNQRRAGKNYDCNFTISL